VRSSRQIRVPSANKGSSRGDIRERLRGRRPAARSGVPTSRSSSVGRHPAQSAEERLAAGSRSSSVPRQPVQQRPTTSNSLHVQPTKHLGPARRAAAQAAQHQQQEEAVAAAQRNAADDESDGGESWAGVGPCVADVTRSARDATVAAARSSADAEGDLLAQLDAAHATFDASSTYVTRQVARGKEKKTDAQKAQQQFNALPLARGRRSSMLPGGGQSQQAEATASWLRQGSSSASARSAVKDAMAMSSGAKDRESTAIARVIGSSMLGQHGLSPTGLHLSSSTSPQRRSPPPPSGDSDDDTESRVKSLTAKLSRTVTRAGSSKVTTALQCVQVSDTEAPLFVRSQQASPGQTMPAQGPAAVSSRLLDHVAPLPPSGQTAVSDKPSTASIYAGLSMSLSAPQSAPQTGKSSASALAARMVAADSAAGPARVQTLTARGALDGASDANWSWETQLRSAHSSSSMTVGTNAGAPSSSSLRLLASAARKDSQAKAEADSEDVGGIDVDALINMTMALGKDTDASSPVADTSLPRAPSPPRFVAPTAAPVQLVGGKGRGMRASKGLLGSRREANSPDDTHMDLTGYGVDLSFAGSFSAQGPPCQTTAAKDDPMAAVALREQLYSKYGIADLTSAVKSHRAETTGLSADERTVQLYTQQYRKQVQTAFSGDITSHLRASPSGRELGPSEDAGLSTAHALQPAPAGGDRPSHRSKPGRKGTGALEGISRQAAVSTAAPVRPSLNQTGSMPPLNPARPFASSSQGGASGGGAASPGSWIARHLPQTTPAAPPQAPAAAATPEKQTARRVPQSTQPTVTLPTSQPAPPPASPAGQQTAVRSKPTRKGTQPLGGVVAAAPSPVGSAALKPSAPPVSGAAQSQLPAAHTDSSSRYTDGDELFPSYDTDESYTMASPLAQRPAPPKQRRPTAAQRSPSPKLRQHKDDTTTKDLSPGAMRRAWAKKRALERGQRALAGSKSLVAAAPPKPVKGGDDLDAEYDSLVAQMQVGVTARWAEAEAAQAEHDQAMATLKRTAVAAGAAVLPAGATRKAQAAEAAPPPPRRSLLPQEAKVSLDMRSKSAGRRRGGLVPVSASIPEGPPELEQAAPAGPAAASKSVDVFRVTSARESQGQGEQDEIVEALRSSAAPHMGIRGSVFIPKQIQPEDLLTRAQRREADTKASHPSARPDLLADAQGAATPEARRGGLSGTSPPSAGRVAPAPLRSTRRGSGVSTSPAASRRVAYSSPEYIHSNKDMAGANISIVGGSGLQSKPASHRAGAGPSRGSLLMQASASAHNHWASQQLSAPGDDDDGSSTTTLSGSDSDSSDGIPPAPGPPGSSARNSPNRAEPASAEALHAQPALGGDDTPLLRLRAKASQRVAAARPVQPVAAARAKSAGRGSNLVAQAASFMAEEV